MIRSLTPKIHRSTETIRNKSLRNASTFPVRVGLPRSGTPECQCPGGSWYGSCPISSTHLSYLAVSLDTGNVLVPDVASVLASLPRHWHFVDGDRVGHRGGAFVVCMEALSCLSFLPRCHGGVSYRHMDVVRDITQVTSIRVRFLVLTRLSRKHYRAVCHCLAGTSRTFRCCLPVDDETQHLDPGDYERGPLLFLPP